MKAIGIDTDPLASFRAKRFALNVSTACFESAASKILKTKEEALRSKNDIDAQ